MLATILLIARVEFDVAIAGSLVLEESQAKVATERHLVAVRLSKKNTKPQTNQFFLSISTISLSYYLFVFLEERQAREGALAKIAAERDGQGRVGGQCRVGIAFVVGRRRSGQNDLAVRRRHLGFLTSLCRIEEPKEKFRIRNASRRKSHQSLPTVSQQQQIAKIKVSRRPAPQSVPSIIL